MNRGALIVSCAIHGCILALVGWSSFFVVPHLAPREMQVNVTIAPGDHALVGEEETPTPPAAVATLPEPSFTPPAPAIQPPTPPSPIQSTPPAILATAEGPRTMPAPVVAKKERPSRVSRVSTSQGSGLSAVSKNLASGGGGGGFTPPQFLLRYKPPYPPEARSQRLEGVVLLLVSVDADGRVTGASIRQGCGHAILDRAALAAVQSWRFTAARQGDRAIPATVEVPIRFHFSA